MFFSSIVFMYVFVKVVGIETLSLFHICTDLMCLLYLTLIKKFANLFNNLIILILETFLYVHTYLNTYVHTYLMFEC